MPEVTPHFAAAEFDSMDNARHAFRALRDDAERFRNLSAWASCTPERDSFFVVLLTEDQDRLNAAAEIVFAQFGCVGNYLMQPAMMAAFAARRYGVISAEFKAQLESGAPMKHIHQEANYDSGAYMGLDGKPRDRSEA